MSKDQSVWPVDTASRMSSPDNLRCSRWWRGWTDEDAGIDEDAGTVEDAGTDEVETAGLSVCAGFIRSTEMVCDLPVDPMIVKNLGYRR